MCLRVWVRRGCLALSSPSAAAPLTSALQFPPPQRARSAQLPELHHRVVWHHLAPGARTRVELVAFIEGRARCTLPALQMLAWEMRFLPTVERCQEADHSIVHRAAAHRSRVGGPYVSTRLRMGEIESMFKNTEMFTKYIDCFPEVKDADSIAKRFGFWRHPCYQRAVAERMPKRRRMQLAGMIMYSLDTEAQFEKMTTVRKARLRDVAQRKWAVATWRKHFGVQERFSERVVEQHAMADHMQQRLEAGRMYSLPCGIGSLASYRDASHVAPGHVLSQTSGPLAQSHVTPAKLFIDDSGSGTGGTLRPAVAAAEGGWLTCRCVRSLAFLGV